MVQPAGIESSAGCLCDLAHQFEAQAVFTALSTGDIRRPVQCHQPGGIHSKAVIRHCTGACSGSSLLSTSLIA